MRAPKRRLFVKVQKRQQLLLPTYLPPMLSFYTGDELGNIKRISFSEDVSVTEKKSKEESRWKLEDHIVLKANNSAESTTKDFSVQKLACAELFQSTVLSVARANGSVQIVSPDNDTGTFKVAREWDREEPARTQKFVGMSVSSKGAFWCTANGVLSFAKASADGSDLFSKDLLKGILPLGLRSWELSSDTESFCYGGTEVDLSVWDTTRAFESPRSQPPSDGKKRGRANEFLPAEIWRAKNLPNDNLNLRQHINITSISYLPSSSNQASGGGVHLATGTQLGDVRRYDTRAARKPVANWVGIGKVGGVGNVRSGSREHELFVSDNGSNLSALDLRNGRVLYSYKQIQGAISDLVIPSTFLASTSQDRFFRLHSTAPPPQVAGQQQGERGGVLASLYMKSIPTAIVADPLNDSGKSTDEPLSGKGEEDPWEGMQDISDDEDDENPRKIRRRPKE